MLEINARTVTKAIIITGGVFVMGSLSLLLLFVGSVVLLAGHPIGGLAVALGVICWAIPAIAMFLNAK